MAPILVRGKHVISKITGPASAETLSDGALLVRDGEIAEMGAYPELKEAHPDAEVLGSSNHLVMPGLVNDHFHVGLSPLQLGAPDLPLELWGIARLGTRYVDPYLDQLYGAVQMIESGTTTVQALHSNRIGAPANSLEVADKVVGAYMDSGMRVSYAPLVANQNALVSGSEGGEEELAAQLPSELAEPFRSLMARGYQPVQDVIDLLEAVSSKYGGDRFERVRVTLAPSNVHRCSDDLLLALKEMATRHKTGIHIHLQETVYQKLYGERAWGKTPLQHLHDLGFLGPEVTCGHSVWTTDDDIEIMAATGTNVCHNASSNLRLQSGIAPLGRLMQAGVRVALGSDEAGINDDKDLFQEMRVVLKLHRVPGIENTPPTACQVLEMATVNGAYSSWFGDRIGTLELGKRADLVLLDIRNIEEPYLDPEVSVVESAIHRGRAIDVDSVMVDGEIVMRDKQLTRVDKDMLYKDLKKDLDHPLRPDELERRELSRKLDPYLRKFYQGNIPQNVTPHTVYNTRT